MVIIAAGTIPVVFSYAYAQTTTPGTTTDSKQSYVVIFQKVKTSDKTPLAVLSNSQQGLKSALSGNKTGLDSQTLQQLGTVIDKGIAQSSNLTEQNAYNYQTKVGLYDVECHCSKERCQWRIQ